MNTRTLDDKVAVITGGNSGIGLATARLFAREGAHVVITGRDAATLAEARDEIGEGALAIRSDAASLDDIDRLIAAVAQRFGRIDVLFLNAGIALFSPFEQVTTKVFDEHFGINVRGPYFTIQRALPLLTPGSTIIFNGASNSQLGLPLTSAYAATKAAVRSLARTLSAELVGRGIRINVISPGPVKTPIFQRLGIPAEQVSARLEQIIEMTPMHRLAEPEEIAKSVLFLASADAAFYLGAELVADGGIREL
jgi:NAD(P)-dependent dehydrogenase (short-subunit alcohol dehydrogenase family)